MYAYVDETYPHQTHFSIPFTMIVVWIYLFVCAFFEMPLWTCLASQKRFETKDFVLAHRPPSNLFP